jgi:hypothetical protein
MQYDLFTLGADDVANDRVALEKEEENSEEFDDDGLCFQAIYGRQPRDKTIQLFFIVVKAYFSIVSLYA